MPHKMRILGVAGQAGSGKDTVADKLCTDRGFTKVALADPIKRFGKRVFGFTDQQLWGPSAYRNAVDPRFESPEVWANVERQLYEYALDYVLELMPSVTEERAQTAVQDLTRWFHWLHATYTKNLSPRIMLQALGTEWGRESVDPDIWVNAMISTARALLHEEGSSAKYVYSPEDGLTSVSMFRMAYTPAVGVVVSDIRFKNEFDAIHAAGGSVVRVIRPDTDEEAGTVGIANHASEAQEFTLADFDFILMNDSSLTVLHSNMEQYLEIFLLQHRG